MSALSYLNNPVVFRLLLTIIKGLGSELVLAEAAYNTEHTGSLHMEERFTEWVIDFLQWQQSKVTGMINTEHVEGHKVWGSETTTGAKLVLEVLDLGQEFVDKFEFDSAIKSALGWN